MRYFSFLWQDKEAVLELERLRQEVSWYRLELMNREGNFNRMFAPHSPVSVATPTVGTAAVSHVCVCVCVCVCLSVFVCVLRDLSR